VTVSQLVLWGQVAAGTRGPPEIAVAASAQHSGDNFPQRTPHNDNGNTLYFRGGTLLMPALTRINRKCKPSWNRQDVTRSVPSGSIYKESYNFPQFLLSLSLDFFADRTHL